MKDTLFAYIWQYSWRNQLVLLAVTVLAFPLLYATLELPKLIINDAIGAETETITVHGTELSQVGYLALLCAGFLGAVLAWGLVKMRINTMKGILAERLLRRFRYQLFTRILRFPLPHFRRTSQGELIAMVTSEAEPLGGIMGDAVAQPVFQAGQMITIMSFLFIQNVWLGLAAVALIPVQATVIPILQRRINRLNKQRVQEVRRLAERIGENVTGVEEIRAHGGIRYALADFSARLGRLFEIRYAIYRQKFFMKFLNNFITQLTPFFFFAIGGYLAIQGSLTVGALVAALAAYKDLAAPWKELLNYYNQLSDMSLRYRTIVEQFAPPGMIDERLFEGEPAEIPRLTGPIELDRVTLREPDGTAVLEDISLSIPPGATVGIKSRSPVERGALAQLLSRSVMPAAGHISVGGHDLAGLEQAVIAARIGVAGPRPYLFSGTINENLMMSLRRAPRAEAAEDLKDALEEAARAGNSTDPATGSWINPGLAGVTTGDELKAWWFSITEAMGTDQFLFQRGLDAHADADRWPDLAAQIVALRPRIAERLREAGLEGAYHAFDKDRFNPGLAAGGNILFAAPSREIKMVDMAEDARFLPALRMHGIEDDLLALGSDLLGLLADTFGTVGTDHPLFRRLNIDEQTFSLLLKIEEKRRMVGLEALPEAKRAVIMTVPFCLSAEQVGEAFPPALKEKILEIRQTRCPDLRAIAGNLFTPLEPDSYAPGLTVLENAVFGKIALGSGVAREKLRDTVAALLEEDGLKGAIAALIGDVETVPGGANLPPIAHERIAFVRAAIKRPDVLVLDQALASHDQEARARTRKRLRDLMPEATLIFLEPEIRNRAAYDYYAEIEDGRLVSAPEPAVSQLEPTARADLETKLRALEKASLFTGLDRDQLRLLAFSAQWFKAAPGEAIFQTGEAPDGAYLLVKGTAELRWSDATAGEDPVTVVEPGRLIGDLSVILGTERNLDLIAQTVVKGLRIGSEELMAVVSADPEVSTNLLRTVAGYLVEVSGRLHDVRLRLPGKTAPKQAAE